MILVDTNIWADHIDRRDDRILRLLDGDEICTHPHVIGEIAMGNLRDFELVIRFLQNLQQANLAQDTEVISLVKKHKLSGTGIGYMDAHLIASLLLTPNTFLWTRDKRLHKVAERLGRAISP